jgi:peptide/nickel transport system substrate-binding protein
MKLASRTSRSAWSQRNHRPTAASLAGVAFAVSALVLSACSSSKSSSAGTSAGGSSDAAAKKTIVIANFNEVDTLDPVHADYAQTNIIDGAVYDTLVTYDSSGKVVGKLASSFALSSDATSISFTLRSAKFHDGTPVTAKDVAYTLDRYKKLALGVATLIPAYKSTTVTDDTHGVIELTGPTSTFLGALSKIFILNSALVTAHAGSDDGQAWLADKDAGSGAYSVSDFNGGKEVVVSAFSDYWDPATGRPGKIVIRRVDQSSTQRQGIESGDIDVALGLTPQDAAAVTGKQGIKVATFTNNETYVFFNTSEGPTANPAVRKAVQLAYDYSGDIKDIQLGLGTPGDGVLPANVACRATLTPAAQNLDQAKQLLADAGISNLHLTLSYQPNFQAMTREATLLQSNLKAIGVTLTLTPITFPNLLASLKSFKTVPQMAILINGPQYPDPGQMLSGFASTAVGSNFAAYSNPKVDSLLAEALRNPDETARCATYKQAQELIYADSPAVFMNNLASNIAYKPGVSGVAASLTINPIDPTALRV